MKIDENFKFEMAFFKALQQLAIISFTDEKGDITWVNENFCKISGYSQDELVGQKHSIVKSNFHSVEFYTAMWNTISNGRVWRGPICNKSKNGKEYWVDSAIFPIVKGDVITGYGSVRYDITSEIEAKNTLKRTSDFATIVNNSIEEGILLQDVNSKIIYFNLKAPEILGLTENQLQGKDSYDPNWKAINKDGTTLKGNEHPSEVDRNTLKPQRNKLMGVIKPSGERVWLNINSTPIVDKKALGGVGTVTTFSDITNKLLQEERDEKLFRLASVGEIAASIAHDIKNPLTIISGFNKKQKKLLDSLNDVIDKEKIENFTELNDKIETSVNRISSIIDVIKNNIRDSSGGKTESVNILLVIEQVKLLSKGNLSEHDIKFSIETDDNDFTIVSNVAKLTQIFTNLVNNSIDAVKYLPEKWIKVVFSKEENDIIISVVDSGSGIPADIVDKIFVPLFTTKSHETESGTGMGLGIVKRLVEESGGKIEVNKQMPNTCFKITFPTK